MKRQNKIIIGAGLLAMIIIAVLPVAVLMINHNVVGSEDLADENKDILVLASDKSEQKNGAVDMAFMVHLRDGKFKGYNSVYPGGKAHPTVSGINGGKLLMHDCLYYGVEEGMRYAQEIVKAETGNDSDAVVLVYTDGINAVIDSVRPLEVDGEVTNLTAEDIIRENDAYNGYKGRKNVKGTMSRGDAVMVLVKALINASKDPEKKNIMAKTALDEYNKGNIRMLPEGSFVKLLATKGFESITS